MRKVLAIGLMLFFTTFMASTSATVLMKPTFNEELQYPDILKGSYSTNITKPESFLGFAVGHQTATPEQINQLVNIWAQESDKVNIIEYARSYEGRPLHYLIISSPANLAKLTTIEKNVAALSKPDNLSKSEINKLIADTPATAWMSYSIHGNESSGADSALALIYQLIASTNADVTAMLDDLVIFVDPMMNPDGRARFTKRLQENRGAAPNIDSQSLLHSGSWPFGRGNHYLYDLNRDFFYAVNPETKGRVKAINNWYPLLMIDGHEMGSLDNYLFGPPRDPLNSNIPANIHKWGKVFANDQAEAFDSKKWRYYTGEWFENLYPGYSNYSEYRGSIHILYEQARTAEDGIKLYNGKTRTYKQSVDHQFVSALANLNTLQNNKTQIWRDFVDTRLAMVSKDSQYANKSYVILPTNNTSRLKKLTDILDLQGITYFETSREQKVKSATNHLGRNLSKVTIPKGALVIQNRQYEAPLIAAIMEFDAKIKPSVLLEERQKTLRDGSSVMYDNTAWNVSMMLGLEALEVPQHLTSYLQAPTKNTPSNVVDNPTAIAYLVDGETDGSVAFAARLMEQGVKVRVLDKKGVFNNVQFARGSVVVALDDNKMDKNELLSLVSKTNKETKTQSIAITQGLGQGDLPDIGSRHFQLLTQPNIAILSQNGVNVEDIGSIWHMLDTEVGIRHSHLAHETFNYNDLRRYNVLVVPSRYYGSLSKQNIAHIDNWVKNGGTLIVNGNSAAQLTKAEKFTAVKTLSDSFDKSADYRTDLYKEWLATQTTISNQALLSQHIAAEDVWFPWSDDAQLKPLNKAKLQAWDKWTKQFMPSGAFIASRTDQKHWLTYGVNEQLPVLVGNDPLFMAKGSVDAVVRYGVLVKNNKSAAKQLGWAVTPEAHDLYVRMSGLLWPEANQRVANAAYLTREAKGKGQIIMFANKPNYRGATKGTARLLLNAMIYGPGLGARPVIQLN